MRAPAPQDIAAAARAGFKRHRDHLLALISHLDALIAAASELRRLDVAVLRAQRDDLQGMVDRIGVQLRSRAWLYFGLLQAADGIDLGYTSPDQGKPYGPGVDYLMDAAAAQGYPIGPDRARALIVEFNALPRVTAKLGGKSTLTANAVRVRKGQPTDE
jgi:hypothetical protein